MSTVIKCDSCKREVGAAEKAYQHIVRLNSPVEPMVKNMPLVKHRIDTRTKANPEDKAYDLCEKCHNKIISAIEAAVKNIQGETEPEKVN